MLYSNEDLGEDQPFCLLMGFQLQAGIQPLQPRVIVGSGWVSHFSLSREGTNDSCCLVMVVSHF